MNSLFRAAAKRAVPAVMLSALIASVADAQSADDTFQEGVQLYLQNRAPEALEKFKEVLAENPSNEQALAFMENAGREALVLMMQEGGDFTNVAARFFDLARIARKEKRNDPDAIAELVDQVMSGDYLAQRDAIYQLSADHGEYGAAPFVPFLGDEENEDARVRAIFALTKLSGDSVLPVVAGLSSGDQRTIWNATAVLGAIGDPRALAWVKGVHESTDSETVKSAAALALERLSGRDPSALPTSTDLHIAAAIDHFMVDDAVVRPFDTPDAVWNWESGEVVATQVPAILRPLELAEQHCFAAIHHPKAQAVLVAVYAGEKAAVQAAETMEIELDAADSVDLLLKDIDVSLAAGGPDRLSEALRFTLESDAPHAALVLVDTLESLGAGSEALRGSLTSHYKMVRYHAAFALARGGDYGADVVSVLQEALAEDAIRTVLVVDDQSHGRNSTLATLAAAGYAVVGADSGALGFLRSRAFPAKDLIIVRAGLTDVTVDQFVYDSDFRAAAAPILIVADAEGADDISSNYEGKGRVAGILAEPVGDEALLSAAEAAMGDLNREREMALKAAEQAAAILAHIPAQSLGSATASLIGALDRDEESVLVPVLHALANVGPSEAVLKVSSIFADDARSEDVRVAAARALGGIFSDLEASPGEDVINPVIDAARSDDSAAVRVAAGRALGWARFMTDDQRAGLLRDKR